MTSDSSSFPSTSPPSGPAGAPARRRALLASLRQGASSPAAEDLSARFAEVGISSSGGGVDPQRAVSLTSGESVFVVHDAIDMTSNTTLCGVEFGSQGKLCFRSGCAIQSHVEARRLPGFHLDPGIYVKTGPDKYVVHNAPVGEVSLMENHGPDILSVEDCTPAVWNTRFNTWRTTVGPNDAKRAFDTIKKAKAFQTPSKRAISSVSKDYESRLLQELTAEEILAFDVMEVQLEACDSVIARAASEFKVPLDEKFSLGSQLLKESKRLATTIEATVKFRDDQQKDRAWTEKVIEESSLRITDLEKVLGTPSGDAATVWSAISTITSGLDTVMGSATDSVTRVVSVEKELEEILVGLQEFRASLSSRVSSLETLQQSVPEDFELRIKSLEEDKETLQHRLDTIEARMDVDNAKVTIGSSILRSPLDLSGYCIAAGLPDGIKFGGFVDVYTFLLRIQSRMESSSLDKMIKTRRVVQSLDLTLAEAVVTHSHESLVPPIFGSVVEANPRTALSNLPSHKSWRNRADMTGLAYTIERSRTQIDKEVKSIIELTLPGPKYRELNDFAKTMLLHSQSFLAGLVRWVDETYEHLIDGGSPPDSVWLIITRVIKEIFEEYLAPARSTGTDAGFVDKAHESTVMIWGAAKTDVAVCQMSDKGIRNHPVVVGAYAQWMVGNSGLREADSAKKEALKAIQAVNELKTKLADQGKTISEVKTKLEQVRKTADKANHRASSGSSS
jgi:hypothetical protein